MNKNTLQLSIYGKEIMDAFTSYCKQCNPSIMSDCCCEGTLVLRPYVKTFEDEAAWYLFTYDDGCIEVLNTLLKNFADYTSINRTEEIRYIESILKVLEKCILKPEKNIKAFVKGNTYEQLFITFVDETGKFLNAVTSWRDFETYTQVLQTEAIRNGYAKLSIEMEFVKHAYMGGI